MNTLEIKKNIFWDGAIDWELRDFHGYSTERGSTYNSFLVMDEKTGNFSQRGQKIVDNTPMGKFGEPEDLQGASLFLMSDVSSFITGIVIPVDGGYSAFGGV